ncbi:MAG TPA: imidazole glycerol phosphate synthase subunit HisH [Bacillus bacterium]|nr:imidazole glycerol phosphate synthase subunit HisH [Bacillus sp. (in: firmicutes)]
MIGIIDYGMGNLYSVSKALERMNYQHIVTDDQDKLNNCKGLILPGVGAFRDAMTILNQTSLTAFIKNEVVAGKPLLGICLGMQLLFDESEENGITQGLQFLKGKIVKFPGRTASGEKYKVPHMGWNKLNFRQPESALLRNVEQGHVYFVHSYYAVPQDDNVVLASSIYDVEVPAVVGQGNVYGTQFHPEKSSEIGLSILMNFSKLVEGRE